MRLPYYRYQVINSRLLWNQLTVTGYYGLKFIEKSFGPNIYQSIA